VKRIIILTLILIVSSAVAAFAVPAEIPADTTAAVAKGGTQVTIGGEIRFRATTYRNTNDFNRHVVTVPETLGGAERSVVESRFKLSVEAKVSPNTIGLVQMEAASTGLNYGENTAWGSEGCRTYGGSFRCGDVKSNEFRVLQAWIQHSGSGLLGVPAYIKIGHQPIIIGSGMFYRHNFMNDDAIVLGVTPIKGLDLTALTVKLQENGNLSADDQDFYSAIITYAVNKDILLGADVSFLDSQTGSVLPNAWSHLWNIGLNARANVAGFTLRGEVDIQTGRDNWPGNHWDYRGYAALFNASYKLAPVTLTLDLAYTSGDSKNDNKVTTFLTSQCHAPFYSLVYDHLTSNAASGMAGGLQNTVMLKLGASADVMKDFNITPSLIFLQAAKKSFGAATPTAIVTGPNGGTPTSSRYIGTEIDAVFTYQIDKGLKWYLETGYLFAGNYWKAPAGLDKVSDPWMARMGLMLNF
jgi:hypothetical protein